MTPPKPSRRRLTQAEPYCLLCGVWESLNPVEDHENWTGHPWRPTTDPTRRRLTMPEWEAELKAARANEVQSEADLIQGCRHGCDHSRAGEPEPLRTRTGRRRSWWQRGWKR